MKTLHAQEMAKLRSEMQAQMDMIKAHLHDAGIPSKRDPVVGDLSQANGADALLRLSVNDQVEAQVNSFRSQLHERRTEGTSDPLVVNPPPENRPHGLPRLNVDARRHSK